MPAEFRPLTPAEVRLMEGSMGKPVRASAEIPFAIKTGQPLPTGVAPRNAFDRDHPVSAPKKPFHLIRQPFDSIQGLVAREAGGTLPQELVEQLGLQDLNWFHYYHPDNLPLFYVGVKEKGLVPTSEQRADGSIVVYRIAGREGIVFTATVQVAGVGVDSAGRERAIGANYNPNNQSAIGITTSVLDSEVAEGTSSWVLSRLDLRFIPTPREVVLGSGGFITEAMVSRVYGENVRRGKVMHAYNPHHNGYSLTFSDPTTARHYGFTAEISPRHCSIAHKPQSTDQGLQPWRVSIPRQLQTV